MSGGQTQTQQTITQIDAAKRYGVSDRTIRRWERDRLISGNRVRGLKLYPVAQLDKLTGATK